VIGTAIIGHPMSNDRVTTALDLGSGTSTGHHDGVRWVDYENISWNPVFCKRCDICVDICPKGTLVLRDDAILEEENCILCGLCERYCPDLAIEMIPAALAAHAAKADEAADGEDAAGASAEAGG
jgi:2-oxoglutarate ferredoxin oxidoreductase subunit delta